MWILTIRMGSTGIGQLYAAFCAHGNHLLGTALQRIQSDEIATLGIEPACDFQTAQFSLQLIKGCLELGTQQLSAYQKPRLEHRCRNCADGSCQQRQAHRFHKSPDALQLQLMQSTGDGLMAIFAEVGAIRHLAPESEDAQALIAKLQAFISEHYYTCTPQILRGLGMMYIAGDSMTENIDKAGGPGTAEFTHKAIEIYTK